MSAAKKKDEGSKALASNRKAFHEYEILEKVEAGLVLTGTEIKAIREGKVSIQEAYVRPRGDELFLVGANIEEYSGGNQFNHPPARIRKLLLHRSQIDRILVKLAEKGLTLVPLNIHLRGGWAKIDIALAKGRRAYDKRDRIKKREAQRDIERARAYERRR